MAIRWCTSKLEAGDVERMRAFYFELFGCDIKMDPTGYSVVDTGPKSGSQAASSRHLPRCLRT